MKCPKCNLQIDETMKFCSNCGTKIENNIMDNQVPVEEDDFQEQTFFSEADKVAMEMEKFAEKINQEMLAQKDPDMKDQMKMFQEEKQRAMSKLKDKNQQTTKQNNQANNQKNIDLPMDYEGEAYFEKVNKSWCIYDIILGITLTFAMIFVVINTGILTFLHLKSGGDILNLVQQIILGNSKESMYQIMKINTVIYKSEPIILGISLLLLIFSFIMSKTGKAVEFYKDKKLSLLGIVSAIGGYFILNSVNANINKLTTKISTSLNMDQSSQINSIQFAYVNQILAIVGIILYAIGILVLIYGIYHIIDYAVYLLKYES